MTDNTEEAVAWRVKDFADGWILCHTEAQARREAQGCGNIVQPLFSLETRDARIAALEAALEEAVKGLEKAEQFIVNGIETGHVRLPETTFDPAHETLPAIRATLTTIRETKP